MPRLPTWLGPAKLRRFPPAYTQLSGKAAFSFGAQATPQLTGSASFGLDAQATIAFQLSGTPSKLRPPQWLGPAKLRASPRGTSPAPISMVGTASIVFSANATAVAPIMGVASITFGAIGAPLGNSKSSKLRPPQWLGPGKLRASPRGIVPPPPGPIVGSASFSFGALATITRASVSFKYRIGPSNAAPFNPTQFTTRPPAYSSPGPIRGAASIVFGTNAVLTGSAGGTAAFVLDATGVLVGSIQAGGIADLSLDAFAFLGGVGALAGSAGLSLDASGTLTSGALVGSADFAFDGSADVGTQLSGIASFAIDGFATALNLTGLSGSAGFTLNCSVNFLASDPCYVVISRGQKVLKSC